jgi:hypothetical protein
MSDEGKFAKAAREKHLRDFTKARERAIRGEGPGEHAEHVTLLHETDGVPDKVFVVEIGAAWVGDSEEDHPGLN